MSNNQVSKNDFIREQIKEKPVNKRRVLNRIGTAALSGATFAVTACIVFAVALPHIMAGRTDGTELNPQINATEQVTEAVPETEYETETEAESDAKKDIVVDIPEMNISIDGYQKLQDQLYAIGGVAKRSIVTITTVKSDLDWFNNSFETEGQGSGIILESRGDELLILTEKKVISDAKRMSVTFANNFVAEATLHKYDADTGIAILSVDKTKLDVETQNNITYAKLGNSKLVRNGAIVIAMGSPLGTTDSILTGNITSTQNSISRQDDNYGVFTTDIVGSKNGSGVLINVEGEVVGIIMQGQTATENGNTLTAIGISEVKSIIELLMNGKDIPYLGTSVITVNDKIAFENEIPRGVYIKQVAVDSPAMLAGLQSGDVICKVNKVAVSTVAMYSEQVMKMVPGESYEIVVKRQGANGYYDVKCTVEAGVME